MIFVRRVSKVYFGIVLFVAYFAGVSICAANQSDIGLRADDILNKIDGQFKLGSHVKLYIPNLPYLAISHAINGALLRPADNKKGWQYDLAVNHRTIDDKVWEFDLRKDAYFQDGSHFDADSVIENVAAFQKQPFSFSPFASKFSHVEKVSPYKVRFHMKEPYGAFPYDAIWLQFYTSEYLAKFGWNGKPTCPNLAEPGLYGLGPYILTEGYVEGDRRSSVVELVANKNYWGESKPKVERITINLDISSQSAFEKVTQSEGAIDIMPIPFAEQVETVLSQHAKLSTSASKNNYAMHFNMISGHEAISDPKIREIINRAIDQEYLLNLSMLGQGVLSPTMVSPNFYRVDEAIDSLSDYLGKFNQVSEAELAHMAEQVRSYQRANGLNPKQKLPLTILVQESFLFLIKDIQYFLSQVNIQLTAKVMPSETEIFEQLLVTWKQDNTIAWDLLLWGNTDWYKHPWSAFFVYLPNYAWSTIQSDDNLVRLIDNLFRSGIESQSYVDATAEIIRYVHQNNLMVFLPTPNNVFAINKEVYFKPGSSAFVYLRDLQVSDYHWSLRSTKTLPKNRLTPIEITTRNPN